MKKIFTIDNFIVGFIPALGYGLGFDIPKILGWEMWQCILLCFAIGGVLDAVANKIVFSKFVQSKTSHKILVSIAFLLIFLAIVQYVVVSWAELPILDYLIGQYVYIIIPAILGFAFNNVKRWYLTRKIRERYGDGSKGFLYDDVIKRSEVEEWNKQNQPIKGKYDTEYAVKTKTGIYVGYKENKCMFYMGIPYAKPPLGERRWKAPEPMPESNEIFEAKYFGASEIQVEHEGSILKHHRQSEDCLTLNIGFVRKKTNKKKPVLVLFHHGDFSYGGAADPLLYGDNLADTYPDIVAVSFNYRLGIFGFIDFSDIPGGKDYPDALNLGLLDQIAALKWIKENISTFGGDPDNITVMGFESGAISISLLAACKQAKGLFQKAFIFFGSPDNTYATSEKSRNLAKKLLEETSTATMQELQRLPTERLKDAAQKLWLNAAAPTRDGKLIPLNVFEAYKNGAAEGIEFIIGIASNERDTYKSFVGKQNYEEIMSKGLREFLAELDTDTAQSVKTYIEEQAKSIPKVEAQAKIFEQWSASCTYLSAMQLAKFGNEVRLIYWNATPLIKNLGSGTVDVVSALLGNSKTAQMYGKVLDSVISKILQTFFQKFMNGETIQLYNNELKGVDAIEWKVFPKALIVSNKKLQCKSIEDRLTEVEGLLEFFKNKV